MLQCKDINKIDELKTRFTPAWVEPDFIKSSLKSFSFSSLCNCISPLKLKGYSIELILSILISIPFVESVTVNSMLGNYVHGFLKAGKDTFYRLKNNPKVCWRLILWLFANKFKQVAQDKSSTNQQSGSSLQCLVFDDTVIQKTGRFIEKVSRVWDHVTGRYILGFKMLLMGYWDGTSFIPVDFSLHREHGKNKEKPFGLKKREMKRQYKKPREKGSCTHEREKEADMSKIESAIKMFKRAIGQGFHVDYVLMDSWFTCEAFIEAIQQVKKQTVNLIGMYKIARTKFCYNGQDLTYSQIRNQLGKAKRCRKLKLYYKEAIVIYNEKAIKLCFSKQGKNGKWKVFLCTDTKLTFIKMIEIYQTRWTIEVFFKESKQLLDLGKCQSNDFDAHIADITITMIQHMLLTLRYRFDNYESKGGLFRDIKTEMVQQRLNQRLWGLFIELIRIIELLFEDIDHEQLMIKIFNDDRANQLILKLLEPNCNKYAA